MSIQGLIRYGNWSGPGWTAGRAEDDFGPNEARALRDDERDLMGIDAYDNFVAKAHDLNEYAAEGLLRNEATNMGLITNQVQQQGTKTFYAERFKFGSDIGEGHRFVSFAFYRDALQDRGAGAEEMTRLRQAFYNYYMHIALSNCQFGVDYVRNEISLIRNIFSGSWGMKKQLAGAAHIFLDEADNAEKRVFRDVLAGVPDAQPFADRFQIYISDNFVYPMDRGFQPVRGTEYKPSLTKAAMTGATRKELLDAGVALRDEKNSSGNQEQAFRGAGSRGFDSPKALIDALAAV